MSMKTKIKEIKAIIANMVNDSETPSGRRFEIYMAVIVVGFAIVFTSLSFPACSYDDNEMFCWSFNMKNALWCMEAFLMIIFMGEYAVRCYFASNRGKYQCSCFGIIDIVVAAFSSLWLLAIVLHNNEIGGVTSKMLEGNAVIDIIKILFALKLLRSLKLLKSTWDMYLYAFKRVRAKGDAVTCLLVAIFLVCLAGFLIWAFENEMSVSDALWWAVVTFSTVGYGDIELVTSAGKITASLFMLIGIIIVAVPAGLLVSAFVDAKKSQTEDEAAEDIGKNKEDINPKWEGLPKEHKKMCKGINRMAMRLFTKDIGFFVLVVMILMYVLAGLIWAIENEMNSNIRTMGDALWWAVVTLSTVGYGDIELVTPLGRPIAVLFMLVGIIIVAIPAGLLVSTFVDVERDKPETENSGKNKEGQKSGRIKDIDIAKQESNSG